METIKVTVSLPKSLLAAAGVRKQDVAGLLREAVAVDLYRRGRLSLGKAAEVAGVVSKWEMMALLAKHDVCVDYTADDAAEDATALAEALRP